MSNLQYWEHKARQNQTPQRTTDEAETTKKDPIEEKNVDNDPEIGPVVDEDPSQLDEEPDVDQLEVLTAMEAWETCPRQLDTLGTPKIEVSSQIRPCGSCRRL